MSDTNIKVKIQSEYEASGTKAATGDFQNFQRTAIEVQGSAKRATADITAMEQAVARFKTAISGISNGNFKAMSSATKQLRSDLDSIRGSDAIRQAFKDLDSGNPTKMISAVKTLDTEYQRLAGSAVDASVEQKNLGKSISESASHASSSKGKFASLVSSLGRIAKLRFLRGIIRGISQAISEGANNIYQYSAALGNADASHFSGSMDALATTLLQVKNAVGSVIAPLMGILLPAIQTVAGWFIMAANAVAQFFAALGGQTTYTRAKEHATAWKEVATGAGSAAAAAEEYKNTILGFDEINALNDTSNGGGGGGGGASAPDFSDMFEEVPLEKTGIIGLLNDIASLLRPFFTALGDELQRELDGWVKMINGAIESVKGLINDNVPQMLEGMNQIVEGMHQIPKFQGNLALANGIVKTWTDGLLWIKETIADFALFVLENFGGIIETLYGIDVDPMIDKIKEWKDEIGDQKKTAEALQKINDLMVDGTLTASEAIAAQALIGSGYHNIMGNAEACKKKIDELAQSGNLSRESILRLAQINPTFRGILASTGDVDDAIQKILDGQFSIEDGFITIGNLRIPGAIIDGLAEIGTEADDVTKQVGGIKDKANEVGRYNPSTSTIRNAIGSVASTVNAVIEKITGCKNSVTEFGKHNPSMENVKSAIAKPGASADTTTGKVWTMANTVSAFGHASIYPSGIINGIFSVGDAADRASGKLGVLAWNVGQIQTATIGKVKDVARAFLGYAEGGFVPTFAEGGIVPRFDGGGINSANLFLAHENGIPEMVGRIGNRTAVANQGQMVEAMAQGVRMAMSDLMSGSGNTEVNVYMDGHKIARAVDRQNQIKNRRFNVRMA